MNVSTSLNVFEAGYPIERAIQRCTARTILPYQGTIDWHEVIHALNEVGYSGDFTYEAHRSIRHLPDELRDAALRYAASVGQYLISE